METHAYQAPKPRPPEAGGLTPVTILPNDQVEADLVIVRGIAKVMDEAVTVPGTKFKFGLDSIIGLIPFVGDAGSAAISAYLLRAASRLGVPLVVQLRMLLNIVIDGVIGVIPFVGDVLDVLYKANARNARLILESVEHRGAGTRSSWLIFIGMLLALVTVVGGTLIGAIFLAKWAWNAVG